VLVHYGAFGEGGRVNAYALGTLDELWQQDQPNPAGSSVNCYGMPCVRTRDGLTMLDPRTGASRWHVAGADLMAFGAGSALEVRNMNRRLRTVDRVTGQVQAELVGWRGYYAVDGRDAYVLSRPEQDRSTAFGLLLPGADAIQPLGRLPGTIVECQPVRDVIACQVGDNIEIWSYRA